MCQFCLLKSLLYWFAWILQQLNFYTYCILLSSFNLGPRPYTAGVPCSACPDDLNQACVDNLCGELTHAVAIIIVDSKEYGRIKSLKLAGED